MVSKYILETASLTTKGVSLKQLLTYIIALLQLLFAYTSSLLFLGCLITGLDYWTGLLDSNFKALKSFLTRSTSLYSCILHYLGLLFSVLELLNTLTSH